MKKVIHILIIVILSLVAIAAFCGKSHSAAPEPGSDRFAKAGAFIQEKQAP